MSIYAIFAQLLGISLILALAGGLVFGVIFLVRFFFKLKKLKNSTILIYYIFMILCLLVMIASWLLNMGWIRVILTWLAFPIYHSVAFVIINCKSLPKLIYSAKLKIYTLISYVAFFSAYAFLPDGGDIGEMPVFFGLLHNNTIASIAGVISVLSFVANILFMILQIIQAVKTKVPTDNLEVSQ